MEIFFLDTTPLMREYEEAPWRGNRGACTRGAQGRGSIRTVARQQADGRQQPGGSTMLRLFAAPPMHAPPCSAVFAAGGLLEQSWEGQLRELEAQLARSQAGWKLVVGHHPIRWVPAAGCWWVLVGTVRYLVLLMLGTVFAPVCQVRAQHPLPHSPEPQHKSMRIPCFYQPPTHLLNNSPITHSSTRPPLPQDQPPRVARVPGDGAAPGAAAGAVRSAGTGAPVPLPPGAASARPLPALPVVCCCICRQEGGASGPSDLGAAACVSPGCITLNLAAPCTVSHGRHCTARLATCTAGLFQRPRSQPAAPAQALGGLSPDLLRGGQPGGARVQGAQALALPVRRQR